MLDEKEYCAAAIQACVSVWHEAGAAKPNGVSLQLLEPPTCVALDAPALDPQLVIWDFRITSHGHDGKVGRLVQGQLHIRTPASAKRATELTNMRTTRQALTVLEQKANSGVVQPTVCILTGDVNLSKVVATAVVQPDVGEPDLLNHWHTEASNAANSGDVAFVKGTASKAWDVSIGASYEDRGMRRDQHDQVPSSPMLPPMPATNIPTEPEKAEQSASASSGVPLPAAATPDTGTTEEGTAATSSGVPQPVAAESTERRGRWKRGHQEQQEEKRVARNRVAYTREEFFAYYTPREQAQSEWDNAAPPGPGPRNALTHNEADAILEDMRRWYEERLDGEDVSVGWKHLQQCLFKTVTVPLDADIWRNPNLGAAQPEDESEGQVMVVSKEHVAHQIREVITWREKWLA